LVHNQPLLIFSSRKEVEVSILLPSLRKCRAISFVRNLELIEPELDYEVIVVSPFPIFSNKVVWVPEGKPMGNVVAGAVACKYSKGAYMVCLSDDVLPTLGSITTLLNFIKQHSDPFAAGFSLKDLTGAAATSKLYIYGHLYACFLGVSRRTIEAVGGFYLDIYKAHWADPDFCLRVYQAGGTIEVCEAAELSVDPSFTDEFNAINSEKYFHHDLQTFLDRWHFLYGNGIPVKNIYNNWSLINHP